MSVMQAIRARRSIRAYQSGAAISDEQLRDLLEAAMLAPSGNNRRPWEFVVVRQRDRLDALMQAHPYSRMLATATLAIVVCALPQVSAHLFAQDCGAATENILLQAADLGLGTCWCGVYPSDALVARVRAALDIPEPLLPFSLIAVGVPAESPDPRGWYEAEKVHYL